MFWANLGPVRGAEQAGNRPVVLFQNDDVRLATVVVVPLTTNLKRARFPTCLPIKKSESGLPHDSVALCHQIRVLDKERLSGRAGTLSPEVLKRLEEILNFTLGTSD